MGNTTNPFNKQVALGLGNHDPFNKSFIFVLIDIVEYS